MGIPIIYDDSVYGCVHFLTVTRHCRCFGCWWKDLCESF